MTQTNTGSASAAHIAVPTTKAVTATSHSPSNDEVPFTLLRELQQSMKGVPMDQQVIILIQACIEAGVHEGKRLTGILHHLGFNRQYVGIQLSRHTDNDSARHRWYKDENGLYQLMDQPDA